MLRTNLNEYIDVPFNVSQLQRLVCTTQHNNAPNMDVFVTEQVSRKLKMTVGPF